MFSPSHLSGRRSLATPEDCLPSRALTLTYVLLLHEPGPNERQFILNNLLKTTFEHA
jgi:hypothetical protein